MNDIALLKLPDSITFKTEIQPIALPKENYASIYTKTTVVGWVTLLARV